MNKKGFVLTETLMVTVFITIIFTFIYTSIVPLFGIYQDKASREENIDIVYKLYHIRKMIRNDINEENIINSDLRRISCQDLNDQTYCDNLMTYLNLNQYDLLFTKSIHDNLNNIKSINNEVSEYISKYSNDDSVSLILIDKENHTRAHLNYYNKNTMDVLPSTILDYKDDIEEIYFKKERTLSINSQYKSATIKADLTYNNNGKVLSWLTPLSTNPNKYALYIESNDITYLNTGERLFENFVNLKKIEFGNIDTSHVTKMDYMFHNCNNLITLDLSKFDTTLVLNMAFMFSSCDNLTNIVFSNINTKSVINMSGMFNDCKKIANIDLSQFDTRNVTSMESMFNNCKELNILNLNSFNTSIVSNMSNMFSNCENITYINISSFDTGNVLNMSHMFDGDKKLSVLNLNGFNTEKVEDMSYMFSQCESIILLNLSSFKTNIVKNMDSMFHNCNSLETVYVSNLWTTDLVTSSSDMFYNNTNIKGENNTMWDSDNPTDKTYARIDTTDNPGYFTYKE